MSIKYLLGYIDALPSPAAPGRKANGVNGVNNKRSSSYGVIPSTASQHQQPEADRQKHAGGSYAKSATPKFKAEELKQLLTEAKEGLEIKNTTHEFFETLERITNELRGMTEHSTAFLARVRKSDAPDYYNIIKHPMDLGTVLKKVKAQQYKEKKAFKADLDLIWDNCLLYNTLPSHPLRRSANILRNRANHLLEFVTDPAAQTAAPILHGPPGTVHIKSTSSRLDALDAAHVINSTIGTIDNPMRLPSEDAHSAISASASQQGYDAENDQTLLDGGLGDQDSDYDDFQDYYEDEDDDVDESIKTRKGLVSLKSQPGGGRNLELLKGLAAQQQQPSSTSDSGDASMTEAESPLATAATSTAPGETDRDAVRERSRSPSARARSVVGTPGPSSSQLPIPDLPGTVPGQGAALLARRATANIGPHGHRERRMRKRTPSIPPQPTNIPFPDRPALIRTPESMAKFAELSSALMTRRKSNDGDTAPQQYAEAYTKALQPHTSASGPSSASPSSTASAINPGSPSKPSNINGTSAHAFEVEALPLLFPLATSIVALAQTQPPEHVGSSSPHPNLITRSRPRAHAPRLEDPSLLWWQAVTSENLLAAGLPDVPFACSSKSSTKSATKQRQSKEAPQGQSQQGGASGPAQQGTSPVASRTDELAAKTRLVKDLDHLKRIRKLHRKLGALKEKEVSPAASAYTSSDEEDVDDPITDDEGAAASAASAHQQAKASDESAPSERQRRSQPGKQALLHYPEELFESSAAPRAAAQAMQEFCGAMLRHTGFGGIQRSALDAMTGLVTQYLLNIGRTVSLYKDRFSQTVRYGDILTRSLAENLVNNDKSLSAPTTPLARMERYMDSDMPAYSEKVASLARRLEAAYIQELEACSQDQPQYPIDEDQIGKKQHDDDEMQDDGEEGAGAEVSRETAKSTKEGDDPTMGVLLRILSLAEPDHLAFHALEIDKENHFGRQEMYASLLRQLYPRNSVFGQAPFVPPPRFVPITEAAIPAQIGLLRPFLFARRDTPYELYPDDSLPVSNGIAEEAKKMIGLSRPEVTVSTGRILLGKRKREINLLGLGTSVVGRPAPPPVPAPGATTSTLNITTGLPPKPAGLALSTASTEAQQKSTTPSPTKKSKTG